MGRRNSVYDLPTEVRQALMQRLIKNGYSDFEAIAECLQAAGYQTSKSGLHRFAQELKALHGDTLTKEIDQVEVDTERMVDLRMRCLEAASRSGHESPIALAKIYLNWVVNGG